MNRIELPILGGAYRHRSLPLSAQSCINLIPVADDAGGGEQVKALIGRPGLKSFATAGSGPMRGMLTAGGVLYVVSGGALYSVTSAGVATSLGTLNTSEGPVSMAYNGLQVIMVDGTNGYTYTLSTATFAQIADADFQNGCTRVVFLDGYFIVTKPDTGEFYISDINDGTAWDPTKYATAEGSPDGLVSLIADHRELWLFGEDTTEVWYNSGDSSFTFDRMSGAFLEQGCAAAHSVAKMDNTVFWLGRNEHGDGMVFRAEGYVPKRVSTAPVEFAFSGYSDISDAVGYCYQLDGHAFYVLTFPTAGASWAFDASTGLWHELQTDGGRYLGACYSFLARKHLVGSRVDGSILEMDFGTFTDAGTYITRERTFQHQSAQGERLFFARMEVRAEAGQGLVSGQGEDPQMMLQWSDDDGRTWGNEHWRGMGKLGELNARCVWNRLGASRRRTFRIRVTDPVRVVITGASIEAGKGLH